MFTLAQAQQVIRDTEADGGGTFYPWGQNARLTSGYVVGGRVKPQQIAWGDTDKVLARRLRDFVNAHRAVFREPNTYLGTWVDDKGTCHLDVSQVVNDKTQAIALGIARSKIAIWDVANQREIQLGGFRARLVND